MRQSRYARPDQSSLQRPSRRLLLAEAPRALVATASLLPATPLLRRAKRGDGHQVLVMPGLGGSDRSTAVLRAYLESLGYVAQPWDLGRNLGPAMPDLLPSLSARLQEVYEEGGAQPVSLVGWSLGGIYARLLAQICPGKVRQVITLGSPFSGHPAATAVYPIVRHLIAANPSGMDVLGLRELAGRPLPAIPSSAIFSKTDGVVPWQIAVQTPSALAENIEVYDSHLGLGMSPTVLFAVADRLALAADDWKPFHRSGWRQIAYGPAHLGDTSHAAPEPRRA
jgi:pimeloyl-ACP methyl ester carboxylesterase